MRKPNKYVDIVFLALFTLSLGIVFYQHFKYDLPLSVYNILALILLGAGVFIKVKNHGKATYLVLALIVLATLNVINFTSITGYTHIGDISDNGDTLRYDWPGIHPLFFLLFLIYWIINRKAVSDLWYRISYGSDQEKQQRFDKEVTFYYDKFKDYNNIDFSKVESDIKLYPAGAQEAINKITAERANHTDQEPSQLAQT